MELSANDGRGGPLGTLAGSVSSVQGVLVCTHQSGPAISKKIHTSDSKGILLISPERTMFCDFKPATRPTLRMIS